MLDPPSTYVYMCFHKISNFEFYGLKIKPKVVRTFSIYRIKSPKINSFVDFSFMTISS